MRPLAQRLLCDGRRVHTDMASPHLYWTGSEPLKETYLPAICRGEKMTAIAVTEPGAAATWRPSARAR